MNNRNKCCQKLFSQKKSPDNYTFEESENGCLDVIWYMVRIILEIQEIHYLTYVHLFPREFEDN